MTFSTSESLKALHTDGFRLEAWNETDATPKNNTLAANTAENMAVPTGSVVVRLTANSDTWYNLGATAVVPSGDAGTVSFAPAGVDRWIQVSSVTNISLISQDAALVCGLFWE